MTAADNASGPAERYAARVAELMRHGYGRRQAESIAEDDVYGRDYTREPVLSDYAEFRGKYD